LKLGKNASTVTNLPATSTKYLPLLGSTKNPAQKSGVASSKSTDVSIGRD